MKKVIGSVETVKLKGKHKILEVEARMDTGASKNSIDTALVKELGLGPVLHIRKINSAHGSSLRPVIDVDVVLHGKRLKSHFTVTDRTHMKYKVLIGRNLLREGFLVDSSRE